MDRLQLFEFSDRDWLPDAWRRYITEYLQFMLIHGPFSRLPELLARVGEEGDEGIVDLCSGSGGPWPRYVEEGGDTLADVDVVLTDLHPNVDAYARIEEETGGRVRGHEQPVDAADVPDDLDGPRTIINGLHQFPPEAAQAILADAVEDGAAIGVFEIMDRRFVTLLTTLFVPLFVLLATPFVRPFRLGRLFWTYLIPIMPLMIFWDGLVSALRTYSPEDLKGFVEEWDSYEWDIGTVPADQPPSRITYLIGKPR